ncbi:MAG: 30S ribosomal protein S9 [Candidatus Paceibacterota bacterium]
MAMKMRKKHQQSIKRVVKKQPTKLAVAAKNAPEQKVVEFKIPKVKYTEGVGRRKVATARVRIYEGDGDFVVNDLLVSKYFHSIPNAVILYNKPFELTGTKGKFAVTARVSGSGIRSQLGALLHGLSRALVAKNPEFRIFLKEAGLLTRDDRMKETRKIGMGGKARRKRQSPKR